LRVSNTTACGVCAAVLVVLAAGAAGTAGRAGAAVREGAAAEDPQSAGLASEAWFGLPLPGPATEQIIDFSAVDLPMIAAPPVADAPELDGHKALAYVQDIVAFSYASRAAGERSWGRLAGTPWAERTVDYVAGEFRKAGLLDIVKSEVPFLGIDRTASDWHVTMQGLPGFGPGSGAVELRSAFPMGQRPEGPGLPAKDEVLPPTTTLAVTAPVVYVGAGTPADLADKNVRGKIAVLRVEPAPAIFYSNPARVLPQQLVNAGAAGVIEIYAAPGNMQVHFGSCVNVPCFMVGGEDGEFLMMAISKAATVHRLDEMQISMSETIVNSADRHGFLLVGKVRGRNSAENLILSAHSDAWFAGANDNASGVAALIALAKHYGRGHPPRHDIYFVLSPGHHSPTGGTTSFVKLHPDVCPANILTVNLEHIGQQGVYPSTFNPKGMGPATSRYGNATFLYEPVNWDSEGREIMGAPLTPTVKAALEAAAQHAQFTAPARIAAGAVAELAPLVAAGATGVQDVEVSPWYHTSGDTLATISAQTLQRVLVFYKDLVDDLDMRDRATVRAGAE
jgi:hypothetical protein